ncbi:hypothetical protein [Paenibacillus agilis]|uniref:Uncharacterized protein n=1 Tax=Paenibacillus agilis TaxID=3020863 RepID=A0A559ICY7_9BACL|nr:hypothetical protein [Paenibacillus agilis]TVX85538.1 hypothetical protein FPZ44_24585 [Paenibacillus agilis]
MNKKTIVKEMNMVLGPFNQASFILNGTEVEISKWNELQYEMHLAAWGEDVLESFQYEGMKPIDIDEPIYCALFKSEFMITNSLECIIQAFHTEGTYSFVGLENTYKIVDPEMDEDEDPELNFIYYYRFDQCSWVIPTGLCKLNGCYTDFIKCKSKAEARKKAIELTEEGKEVEQSAPCPSCCNDYMQEYC